MVTNFQLFYHVAVIFVFDVWQDRALSIGQNRYLPEPYVFSMIPYTLYSMVRYKTKHIRFWQISVLIYRQGTVLSNIKNKYYCHMIKSWKLVTRGRWAFELCENQTKKKFLGFWVIYRLSCRLETCVLPPVVWRESVRQSLFKTDYGQDYARY